MANNASVDEQWAARFANLLGGDTPTEGALAHAGVVSLIEDPLDILTPPQMGRADALAIEAGTTGIALMEQAGLAVAESVIRHMPAGSRIAVMTGPGNNGGDGFVVARVLSEAGYTVSVGLQSPRDRLTGDAAFAAATWTGFTRGLSPAIVEDADLIVDAIFGAGLDRPIEGPTAQVIDAVNASGVPVIAVDLPSGINGSDGRIMGTAIRARETVTFFRLKPGHLLLPGRQNCGDILVADIGIAEEVLPAIGAQTWVNRPRLWTLPPLNVDGHKYTRGHVVVVSGPVHRTGAARLAARGALRAGAGLVTVASPLSAVAVNASHLTAVMVAPADGANGLRALLMDERKNVVVMGPGLGLEEATIDMVTVALATRAAVVLDADALTSFASSPDKLPALTKGRAAPVVITPHDGEFARVFPGLAAAPSKLDRARGAAEATGATVILKGPDTVVASPYGRATIADNAPPQLGTAGSGDVLAGIVGGLLAQGMDPFEAASAAVWIHGQAGWMHGRGLISEDLPDALPFVFTHLEGGAR